MGRMGLIYMKICDRRNRVQHISFLIVFTVMGTVATMAVAASKDTGMPSLQEHGLAIIDVLAYLLVAVTAALVGVVTWNVIDIKRQLRHKVSIAMHNAICEKKIEMEPE